MMDKSKFFETFLSEYKTIEWLRIIDWIFNEEKFKEWKPNDISRYTKIFKNTITIKNGFYNYGKRSKLNPDTCKRAKYKNKSSVFVMTIGSGEGRDSIRHIRNAIAHNNACIFTKNKKKYLELIDYGKINVDKRGGRNAFIILPVDYLKQLYSIYNEIEKTVKKGTNK